MKAKRLFSVIIAMMLMLSCFAVTASANAIKDTTADVSLKITLWQPKDGDADASDGDTFVETGADGAETTAPTGYTAISGSTFTITKSNDPSVTATGTTNSSGVVTFTTYGDSAEKLPQGTYHVTNSPAANQARAVAPFDVDLPMTNAAADGWIYDVKVYPKVPTTTNPTVTKQVKEEGAASYGSKASIDVISGKKAQWKIEGSFPTDIATYTKYILNDDIVANLGSAENVTATFYNKDGEAVKTIDTGAYSLTDEGAKKITFTISDFTAFAPLAGGKVVIEFKTAVTAVATKIPNDVELTYNTGNGYDKTIDNSTPNNDPNTPQDPDHPKPDTPTDNPYPDDDPTPAHDPYVWTGKIDVVKVNSEDVTKPVAGAEFIILKGATDITASVKDTEGHYATNAAGHLVTDAQGKLPTIAGLGAGTYTLREVKAPANYELLGSDITITINEANMTGEEFSGTLVTLASEVVTVKNIPSQKLPLTGGMGVGMFAFAGLALAFVGGVYLSKTRKSEEC